MVRRLIEMARLVIPAIYEGILTALFNESAEVSLVNGSFELTADRIKPFIDEEILTLYQFRMGPVILWSDERSMLVSLTDEQSREVLQGQEELRYSKTAARGWRNRLLVEQVVDGHLDYVEEWLGKSFDEAVTNIQNTCNEKGPRAIQAFQQSAPKLHERSVICSRYLEAYLREIRRQLQELREELRDG